MWTEWHLVGGNDSSHYEAVRVPGDNQQTGCTTDCATAEAQGRQDFFLDRTGHRNQGL